MSIQRTISHKLHNLAHFSNPPFSRCRDIEFFGALTLLVLIVLAALVLAQKGVFSNCPHSQIVGFSLLGAALLLITIKFALTSLTCCAKELRNRAGFTPRATFPVNPIEITEEDRLNAIPS